MTLLQIIETILDIAPAGIELTKEMLALLLSIEAAFGGTAVPSDQQKAIVTALAKHLAAW